MKRLILSVTFILALVGLAFAAPSGNVGKDTLNFTSANSTSASYYHHRHHHHHWH
jgi:hypothetical protein